MEQFCHIGKVVNCNEVLHSKGSSIADVGLGELSLLYFAVLFWFSLTRWNDFYGISIICCVIAVVFTFIFYYLSDLHPPKRLHALHVSKFSNMGQCDYSLCVKKLL